MNYDRTVIVMTIVALVVAGLLAWGLISLIF